MYTPTACLSFDVTRLPTRVWKQGEEEEEEVEEEVMGDKVEFTLIRGGRFITHYAYRACLL